jgi:hypothetical protein
MKFPTLKKTRSFLACVVLFAQFSSNALGGATTATEDEVRAAFLFQLAQYVNWPSRPPDQQGAPLRFCVLGQDRLITTLEPTVRGKSIEGRSIVVLRISSAKQLVDCDLAFIAFQSEKQIRATLINWTYPPVLLVGEADRFAELGGMVNLIINSGRVAFEINIAAAARAHLELRSQLLRFARIVSSEKGAKR